MGSSADWWHDQQSSDAATIAADEAKELGLSPTKYEVLKQLRNKFNAHKANLPYYFVVELQKEIDALFKKE